MLDNIGCFLNMCSCIVVGRLGDESPKKENHNEDATLVYVFLCGYFMFLEEPIILLTVPFPLSSARFRGGSETVPFPCLLGKNPPKPCRKPEVSPTPGDLQPRGRRL